MIIVTRQSPRMADLVYNGEGRDFDRLQEGKYIFYEQTTNICDFSKIQPVVFYQCCVLIGWATTRLYVIA